MFGLTVYADPDSNPGWRPCMCLSTIGSGHVMFSTKTYRIIWFRNDCSKYSLNTPRQILYNMSEFDWGVFGEAGRFVDLVQGLRRRGDRPG